MKTAKIRAFVILIGLLCPLQLVQAYNRGREIKIIWSYDERILYISQDGKPVTNPLKFILRADDRVILGIQSANKDESFFNIDYTIIPPKNPYQPPSEIRMVAAAKSTARVSGQPKLIEEQGGAFVIVTKDLESGGQLLVNYKEKKEDKDKEKEEDKGIVDILFKIKEGYPLFLPSTGLVFSNEANPSLSIVTQGENGDCVLVYKNDKESTPGSLQPKQDLIQFLNFRVYEGVYLAFGFPLTLSKKIYENPHLGVTFYPGQSLAFLLSGGISFHKELQIVESSGYKIGQTVKNTLKVEDIPTEEKYHIRFYMGISFRL